MQYFVPPYMLSGLPQPSITSAPTNVSSVAPFTVGYTLSEGAVTRCAR